MFRFFLIIPVILFTSCGFKPLYKKQESHLYLPDEFAKIAIEVQDNTLSANELKYALAKELNPKMITADKKYVLNLNVTKEHSTTAIQKNTTITRYNVKLIVTYTLSSISTNKTLGRNQVSVTSSFDTSASGYADYVVENFSIKNNIKELCAELLHNIGTILLKQPNEN